MCKTITTITSYVDILKETPNRDPEYRVNHLIMVVSL